ncbi:NAD-dependent epimerase/dehydratase family protein [Bremerella cremea]|uniref:3-beta hydroxysteroid dehydrogenase n=1 Tax=Blastopirellula marina TaxID=124 RepID=A0A2S8FF30_9BACT|nr:3-beta hydroxysteroid dehydrogenase [Blastopirellula marina]RCS43887.1 NAD-dependent epimerase/dehydratase family protein [Bremerella cremea]
MSMLVTGGGGFLGRYIVEQLLELGEEVRVLSRQRYPELEQLGVECFQGDLRDKEAVEKAVRGCEVVFHVAAIAGIWGRWPDYYGINVEGTQNIIAACEAWNVERLVYCSSPSVTFDGTDQKGVNESAPYPEMWLAHYPHSKALAEQMVLAANRPGSLLTCALRPHLIWGPRDQHLIPRLIQRAKTGKLRIVGDGKNLVDMVYVENAASAHIQAAGALLIAPDQVGGKAYFITQGAPVRLWDWINDILALEGLPPVRKRVSANVAYYAGAMMETAYKMVGRMKEEPRMTRFLARQLATHHYFDISSARHDLQYAPKVSTEEGMRRLGEELASRR